MDGLFRARSWIAMAAGCLFMTVSSASESAESPVVVFDTNKGSLTVELLPLEAPKTVENILDLVDSGFYDGLIFHRVIEGFVVQAGGFLADMQYRQAPRTVVNESQNGLGNHKYTLSMARRTDPDSAGAQFYINLNDNTHLDYRRGQPGYTVFGRLIDGMEVAEEIGRAETATRTVATTLDQMQDVPVEPIVIQRAYRR